MPERRFDDGYWDDPFVQLLSRHGKLLFAYLWTNKHCNPAGLYQITPSTIAFETKLGEADIPQLLEELAPKVVWYRGENLVWVKNFIKRQSISSKFLVAVARCLTSINNHVAVEALINYNRERYTLLIPYEYPTNRVSIPSTSTSPSSTGPISNNSLFSASLFSLDEVNESLSKLPRGVDRLVDHEAMKQKLAELGVAKGYRVQSEYPTGKGRVDLCWLNRQDEIVAAFEIDYLTSKDKSVKKLEALGCPNACIVLRDKAKAKAEFYAPKEGLPAEESDIIKRLGQIKGWQADEDDVHWLQGLRSEYPGFTLAEFKACVDYHSGKPVPKHKGIWKNRFRNWMIKKREFELKGGKGELSTTKELKEGWKQK